MFAGRTTPVHQCLPTQAVASSARPLRLPARAIPPNIRGALPTFILLHATFILQHVGIPPALHAVTLSSFELGPRHSGRQLPFTEFYHTIPYHAFFLWVISVSRRVFRRQRLGRMRRDVRIG